MSSLKYLLELVWDVPRHSGSIELKIEDAAERVPRLPDLEAPSPGDVAGPISVDLGKHTRASVPDFPLLGAGAHYSHKELAFLLALWFMPEGISYEHFETLIYWLVRSNPSTQVKPIFDNSRLVELTIPKRPTQSPRSHRPRLTYLLKSNVKISARIIPEEGKDEVSFWSSLWTGTPPPLGPKGLERLREACAAETRGPPPPAVVERREATVIGRPVARLARPLPTPHRRVLSVVYDSTYQALCFDRFAVDAMSAFRARFRLDSLLWQTVVLTDAQLLDGRFFQEVANADELESVVRPFGADMPVLEVSSRAEHLEDALVQLVRPKPEGKLKAFKFSSIDNPVLRAEVASRIALNDWSVIQTWRDIPKLLGQLGVDKATCDRLQKAWTEMIAAQNRGIIRVRKWAPTFMKFLGPALAAESLDQLWARSIVTDDGRHHARRLYAMCDKLSNRTAVLAELDAEATRVGTPSLEVALWEPTRPAYVDDLLRIRAWYERGYNRTTALQNGSAFQWLSVGHPPQSRPEEHIFDLVAKHVVSEEIRAAERDGLVVGVPVYFMELLRDLRHDEFRALAVGNQSVIDQRRAWQEVGNLSALRKAIDPIVKKALAYRSDNEVAKFAEATQIAVRPALGAVLRGLSDEARQLEEHDLTPVGGRASFELEYIVRDESDGAVDEKVIELMEAEDGAFEVRR
ncbi:MAG: hypothetical protein U0414_31945 [Polyangiaceae bacterium]